ncbi:MAG: hypothetical protein R2881_09315 [Eubacteriales bacterium]
MRAGCRSRSGLELLSAPDRAFWAQEGVVLAGMDEVGRGPLVLSSSAAGAASAADRARQRLKTQRDPAEALYPVLTSTAPRLFAQLGLAGDDR